MDWSNETYVKLFTRDTISWKRLRWEGQTVLMHLLRKLDRSGTLDGVEDSVLDISVITGLPEDIVEKGIRSCLKEKVFQIGDNVLLMPNFMEAQETPKSDKLRQKESRDRRRMEAEMSTGASRNVTDSHTASHGVTSGHDVSLLAKPSKAKQSREYSEATKVAEYLLSQIRTHHSDFKKPNMETWAKDIDLAIRVDNRSPRELCEVAKWAHSHPDGDFWKTNILSGVKLRKQYDTVRIQMQSKPKKTGINAHTPRQDYKEL